MPEKILLVDDDLDTLRLVGLMLQRQGYTVSAANSGAQALAQAEKELPDLILLDIMMPEMDGYEVAKRLRASEKTANIPIIMFTAKSQVDDKIMGFEAGADDYLTKPTQPRELFAHIKAVLARTSITRPEPETVTHTEKGHVIAVAAAKGGLGASTLALNLGLAIRTHHKKSVVIADFRPGQGTIALDLGYSKPEGMNRLLQRGPAEITRRAVESEFITHDTGVRLLLSSHQPKDAILLEKLDNFEAIFHHLGTLANFVIIDVGPSLTPLSTKILRHCDEIVLVVEPSPATITQTKAFIADLLAMGIGEGQLTPVLINRTRSGVQLSWSQVQEQLAHKIAVIFTPAPELAYQASFHSVPILIQQPESLTSQQLTKLAEKIAGKIVKEPS